MQVAKTTSELMAIRLVPTCDIPLYVLRGHRLSFTNKTVLLSLKTVLANSVDPDEIQYYAAFHLLVLLFACKK